MTEIKNKVTQFKPVDWRTLNWLQNENLKEIDLTTFEKLKNSLKKNNFINPFNIWKDPKGKLWILDGSHRQRAMIELEKEGVKIPKNLPANEDKQSVTSIAIFQENGKPALKDLVLENIENIKKDSSYIPKAKALNEQIKTMIEMAKLEIEHIAA